MRPPPQARALLCLLVGLGLGAALPVVAARPGTSPQERERLRALHAELMERRAQAKRDADVSMAALHDEMLALADALEAAGLDSLSASALSAAGGLSTRLGQGARAQAELGRAVSMAHRARDLRAEIEARRQLANLVKDGDPELGARMLERTVALQGRARDDRERANVLHDLGKAYGVLGRWADAIRVNNQAIVSARKSGDADIQSYALAAHSQYLHQLHREAEALALADSAIALARRAERDHPLSGALLARSNALRGLERREEALAALEESWRIDRARGDLRHGSRTRLLMANLLFELRRYPECLDHLDDLVRQVRASGDSLLLLRVQTLQAAALVSDRRYGPADSLIGWVLPRYESLRARQDDEASRAGLFARGGELYATRARLYLETGRVVQAWRSVELGRAAVLKERLGATSGAATLAAVQRALEQAGAALVQYNDPQRHPLVVFVVTADRVRARVLGSYASERDAAAALHLMASGGADDACRPPLDRLGRALLDGVAEMIPAGTRRLYLIPPSDLMGLPFEALPLPDAAGPPQTLGDRFAVSYLPAAAALPALAERSSPAAGMLVLADPRIERGPATPRLPVSFRGLLGISLPGARAEARSVAGKDALVLLGRDASKERLLASDLSRRAVIHFATHAVVEPLAADSSGLLLAGRDGLLRATEVERLDLDADLVTLSGCRTGGGESFLGEGTFGLSRAFLIAGARSVVSSLWDVEDRAAARFMALFYRNLAAGLPRDESLRGARQAMAREGYRHRDRSAFALLGLGHQAVPAVSGPPAGGTGRRAAFAK